MGERVLVKMRDMVRCQLGVCAFRAAACMRLSVQWLMQPDSTQSPDTMQSSGSFSNLRNGRPRPADLVTTSSTSRVSAAESAPWPSPSFNASLSLDNRQAEQSSSGSVQADPLRPSSILLGLRSPISIDGLPPTPITAGLKLSPMTLERLSISNAAESSEAQRPRLPGVQYMLLDLESPPASARPERNSMQQEVMSDMPPPPAPMRVSQTGVFSGIPADWTVAGHSGDRTFRDVVPPPAPRLGGERQMSGAPLSFQTWREMPGDECVQGLGLQLYGDASTPTLDDAESTPRLPSLVSPTSTPTLHSNAFAMPGAPRLSSGRFESTVPSSPIQPPLDARWDTRLHFEHSLFSGGDGVASTSTWTPRAVRAAEMERERTVCIEGGLPRQDNVVGLGIDMQRLPSTSQHVVASSSRVAAQAPLRDVMQEDAPAPRRTAEMARSNSTSAIASSPRASRAMRSTGLTPHVEKTRLTPYSAASRSKANTSPTSASAAGEAGTEGGSPSLRTQSKQRSDLLRERALAAASALPAGEASTSPTSSKAARGSSASHGASPRKRGGLAVHAQGTSNARAGKKQADMSPWGVFDLGASKNEDNAWTPLGPPTSIKQLPPSSSAEPKKLAHSKSNAALKTAANSAQRNQSQKNGGRTIRAGDVFGSAPPAAAEQNSGRPRFVGLR